MSVHAGAERNVCIIKVAAATPQSTTNQSQTLLPMCKLAHLPCLTSKTQIDLKCVYITYLHVCMRQYMRFFTYRKCHDSNKPAHFLKFHQSYRCSQTQSMDVDKDETNF